MSSEQHQKTIPTAAKAAKPIQHESSDGRSPDKVAAKATGEVAGLKIAPAVEGEPPVNQLFRTVMLHEASDLHLKAGQPGMLRLRGAIQKMATKHLSQEDMEKLMAPILSDSHRATLDKTGGADFAHVVGNDECRFRVNLFKQRGKLALVARRVNTSIPTFEGLGLPPTIEKLCHYDQGLVILAGVTGSGKSTTIASMLEYMNQNEASHPDDRRPHRVRV